MSDLPANTGEYELTQQDAVFVAEKMAGTSPIEAVILAYSHTDEEVKDLATLHRSPNIKEREYAKAMLRRKAYNIMRQRKIKVLTEHYQERMARMGDVALDTLEELMVEGRSEKVRADVAIEVVRHNLGNPDKDKSGNQNVVIMIGTDPSQQIKVGGEIIDGESN